MKNLVKLFFVFGILSLLVFNSCKDEDPLVPTDTDFELLTTYMAQNNLDLADVLNGWVTSGTALNVDPVDFSIPDYYIIDLRSAADFNTGHIKDAHNTTLTNVLAEAVNAGNKPILVVCYTGQTAGRAVGALRLMGYNAKSLKWGMSAWHADLAGKWNTNATDFASPNWVQTGAPQTVGNFSDPTFDTGFSSPQSILEARITHALAKPWTISKTDLLASPGNYFIVNKWPLAAWDEYGHVSGAYRIDEDMKIANLNFLDPTKEMVVYCYTGQTSSITTMWLDVLGYDTRSLLFGVNGINHSGLLVGASGDAPKKSWHGPGAGSELNFGYYDSQGNIYMPSN
jgi:rhodanese-related sulfurtransferase